MFGGPLEVDGMGGRTLIGLAPSERYDQRSTRGDALERLESRLRRYRGSGGGGAFVALGFDLGRPAATKASAERARLFPNLRVAFYPSIISWEKGAYEQYGDDSATRALFSSALDAAKARRRAPGLPPASGPVKSECTRADYLRAIREVQHHIREGDVYQVNLSQRFSGRLSESPAVIFRRLWDKYPAPLMAYLAWGGDAVVSDSPELFLRVDGREVQTRPIKGTRRRGTTRREDRRLAAELLVAEKDGAELAMIVDLERNDLGRVAEFGSVDVPSFKRLVSLPTVHHLVATVTARLREDVGLAGLLRATFPGGSVTGAPKQSAIEILSRLEPVRREFYCGAIGWLGFDGSVLLNVAIRTLHIHSGRWYLHAGGGIVADSRPDEEYEETLAKARAFFDVLGVAPIRSPARGSSC